MRKKKTLSATVGTALLSLLLLALSALPAAAQQLPNPGFDQWKDVCGKTYAFGDDKQDFTFSENERPGIEPLSWNGSSVNQKVGLTVKKELVFKDEESDALKITNSFVGLATIGSVAPGFVTLGTPWVYAVADVKSCDGGVFGGIAFNNRPDAISVKVNRTDDNAEDSHIIFYSWSEEYDSQILAKTFTWTEGGFLGIGGTKKSADRSKTLKNVERAILGKITPKTEGTLIASADYAFSNTNGWKTILVPVEYKSDDVDEKPEMMNVIISAGEYWDRSKLLENTTLLVDNVELVYYASLSDLNVEGFKEDVKEYTVDQLPKVEDLEYTVKGRAAEAVVDASAPGQITITVTNADSGDKNVYTIKEKGNYSAEISGKDNIDLGESVYFTASVNVKAGTAPEVLSYKWTVTPQSATYLSDDNEAFTITPDYSGEYTVEVSIVVKNDDDTKEKLTAHKTVTVNYVGSKMLTCNGNVIVNNAETAFEASGLTITTTSENTCDLVLESVNYHGMRFKNVKISNVEYSGDEATGYSFSGNNAVVNVDNGLIKGQASISTGSAKMIDGEWSVNIIAELAIEWDNDDTETANVEFTTEPVKAPEEPETPGVSTETNHYHGLVTVSVAGENEDEVKTFELRGTVSVISTEKPDANGKSNVTVVLPAMQFDEIDWNRANPEDYNYNIPQLTVTNVAATKAGENTNYSCEDVVVNGENSDGSKAEYYVTLSGSSNGEGVMRMAITLLNTSTGEEINAKFSNATSEGDEYDGKLTIKMAGNMIADGQDATVNIIPGADGKTATFVLPNLTLEGIGTLGDIRLEDVEVVANEDGSRDYYGSVKGMKLLGGAIVADVDLEGYVDAEGIADMIITVVWEGMNIDVHFTGKQSSSGVEAPVVDGGVVDGPAEYYTIGGVRVNGESLAPGLYIERRGNQVRKILVK